MNLIVCCAVLKSLYRSSRFKPSVFPHKKAPVEPGLFDSDIAVRLVVVVPLTEQSEQELEHVHEIKIERQSTHH